LTRKNGRLLLEIESRDMRLKVMERDLEKVKKEFDDIKALTKTQKDVDQATITALLAQKRELKEMFLAVKEGHLQHTRLMDKLYARQAYAVDNKIDTALRPYPNNRHKFIGPNPIDDLAKMDTDAKNKLNKQEWNEIQNTCKEYYTSVPQPPQPQYQPQPSSQSQPATTSNGTHATAATSATTATTNAANQQKK
jgi:hypothetical protein